MFQQCALVQAVIVTDHIEKNGKILPWWSYGYHLPNFIYTTHVIVQNVEDISIALYINTDMQQYLIMSIW